MTLTEKVIKQKMLLIISEQLGLDKDAIALSSVLMEDLGADEVDVQEIVGNMEEVFDMEMEEGEQIIRDMRVEEMIEYVLMRDE